MLGKLQLITHPLEDRRLSLTKHSRFAAYSRLLVVDWVHTIALHDPVTKMCKATHN